MLTISQLAAYAGVTVRAVRHYHAKGLLPEPERDHSGYRRYDATAVVDLIRIRILADAGVPLSRVKELLAAGDEDFHEAVEEIDRRLRLEIRERQRHRERIARLAHGDGLALPPEAVAYLERMRELGIPERMIEGERDAWIIVAARQPQSMEAFIRSKMSQLEDPSIVDTYLELEAMLDWEPGDPRLEAIADRIVAQLESVSPQDLAAFTEGDQTMPPELVSLLDAMFVEQVPVARDLMRLVEKRGYTGWTQLERIER
ncbi:DNA-binding transcriptional MerR regulator [Nocardioides luteus]|uniref:MerR family transcriptional regulator n=1 Tax=Nocardioides luteus TaxID=1844 RepID=A0ABQ5SPM0_9ACTN|nr:MerR family transcriptional regulator [Nocardioides luteus]MDR7312929.1 DNA-binding transcriptional MerR regulator [Nocardioides luteus]GGR45291.1 MerR family transcriptional regulator [Nocardioides luteus]GLJ65990.1 MerR family transcriptional regulator [Nocardioides luteus]